MSRGRSSRTPLTSAPPQSAGLTRALAELEAVEETVRTDIAAFFADDDVDLHGTTNAEPHLTRAVLAHRIGDEEKAREYVVSGLARQRRLLDAMDHEPGFRARKDRFWQERLIGYLEAAEVDLEALHGVDAEIGVVESTCASRLRVYAALATALQAKVSDTEGSLFLRALWRHAGSPASSAALENAGDEVWRRLRLCALQPDRVIQDLCHLTIHDAAPNLDEALRAITELSDDHVRAQAGLRLPAEEYQRLRGLRPVKENRQSLVLEPTERLQRQGRSLRGEIRRAAWAAAEQRYARPDAHCLRGHVQITPAEMRELANRLRAATGEEPTWVHVTSQMNSEQSSVWRSALGCDIPVDTPYGSAVVRVLCEVGTTQARTDASRRRALIAGCEAQNLPVPTPDVAEVRCGYHARGIIACDAPQTAFTLDGDLWRDEPELCTHPQGVWHDDPSSPGTSRLHCRHCQHPHLGTIPWHCLPHKGLDEERYLANERRLAECLGDTRPITTLAALRERDAHLPIHPSAYALGDTHRRGEDDLSDMLFGDGG